MLLGNMLHVHFYYLVIITLDRIELSLNDSCGLVGLSISELLSDASNDLETSKDR